MYPSSLTPIVWDVVCTSSFLHKHFGFRLKLAKRTSKFSDLLLSVFQEMYSEDWQALGDVQYRKWSVYNMAWDINLEEVVAAGGQFGGPIATLRDSTKMVRLFRHGNS